MAEQTERRCDLAARLTLENRRLRDELENARCCLDQPRRIVERMEDERRQLLDQASERRAEVERMRRKVRRWRRRAKEAEFGLKNACEFAVEQGHDNAVLTLRCERLAELNDAMQSQIIRLHGQLVEASR